MRLLSSLLAFFLGAVYCSAAPGAPMRQSKQFTVLDVRPVTVSSPGQLRSATGEALVRLDADVLLLTAERVRTLLQSELRFSSDGANRIRLCLFPAKRPDHIIKVITTLAPNGWEYRVEIPDQVESRILTRALVHSILLELANRGQGPKVAELPLWLVEGLTAHLLAVTGSDLVIGAVPIGKMMRVVRERRGLDYLAESRETLRKSRPLSFAELGHPPVETLTGGALASYQACAHLFVYELLRLKNGRAHLVATIRELPNCWNWETAFLRGFAAEFRRMLDVEKKWSVDVVAFTARDPSQVWSTVLCLDRLEEVLSVQVSVRVAADQLPEKQSWKLQRALVDWDFASQATAIKNKLPLLEVLQMHAPPDVASLVNDYRQALATYLLDRSAAGRTPETRMQPALSASLVAQNAIRALNALDKRREALRPENTLSVQSPITP
ncbi:MAG: hypothetical protein AB9869_27005 [Verrucomicrobiia bacterium]